VNLGRGGHRYNGCMKKERMNNREGAVSGRFASPLRECRFASPLRVCRFASPLRECRFASPLRVCRFA
jgi:hypothetical protein